MRAKLFVFAFLIYSQARSEELTGFFASPQSSSSSYRRFKDSLPSGKGSGELRFESIQYVTEIPETPSLSHSQYLSARWSHGAEPNQQAPLGYGIDVTAGTFFSRQQSDFMVKELSGSYQTSANSRIYLGRHRENWSVMDSYWQLGLWQPSFAIDLLRPEEMGLLGAFYEYHQDQFSFVAFGTSLFIPSIGPDIREEGGSLVSDSRWYRQPTTQYNFNNRINSISYSIRRPDLEELIGKSGAAFSAQLGQRKSGPWLNVSGGYKPLNELLLKRQNFKQVAQDKVNVVVTPEVTYHALMAADLGYSWKNSRLTLSYLADNPQEMRPEEDWSLQRPQSLQAASVLFDFDFRDTSFSSVEMQVGYLKVEGGKIVDINSDGSEDSITLFDERLRFKEAVSTKVQGRLASLAGHPLILKVTYLYDYLQRGSLMGTEFNFFPTARWAFVVGADALGVDDENSGSSGFLNQYRANDRYYGGLTYVF